MNDSPGRDLPAGDGDNDPAQNPFAGTPFEQMFSGLMSGDVSGMQGMFASLQRMFTPHEGSVNWSFAKELARNVVAQSPDPSPDAGTQRRLQDIGQLADHWLDSVTEFPATSSAVAAWSRAEWIEASMPMWERLVEPVAEHVVAAMSRALPAEATAMAGPMMGILNQLGSALFTQQVGQAVGGLSQEVLTASDIGIPIDTDGRPAIVVANATEFGSGLGVDESDVLLYLVLRECAHQRLFQHAPWLPGHLYAAVEEYGRGIHLDTSRIESAIGSIDPSNMEAVQEALNSGLFDPEKTPTQQAALDRLETALALVEGWVDEVVGQATTDRMPQAAALREAVRRRRASGGPAEETFAALVGLELRPRRLRDASTLWGSLRTAKGAAARDAVWAHPDLLPTAADLDDPLGFADRLGDVTESADFDAALAKLLESEHGDDSAPDDGS